MYQIYIYVYIYKCFLDAFKLLHYAKIKTKKEKRQKTKLIISFTYALRLITGGVHKDAAEEAKQLSAALSSNNVLESSGNSVPTAHFNQ